MLEKLAYIVTSTEKDVSEYYYDKWTICKNRQDDIKRKIAQLALLALWKATEGTATGCSWGCGCLRAILRNTSTKHERRSRATDGRRQCRTGDRGETERVNWLASWLRGCTERWRR